MVRLSPAHIHSLICYKRGLCIWQKRPICIWQKRPKRTNGAFKPSTHPLPGGAANLDVLAPKKAVRGSVTVTHSIVREHIL